MYLKFLYIINLPTFPTAISKGPLKTTIHCRCLITFQSYIIDIITLPKKLSAAKNDTPHPISDLVYSDSIRCNGSNNRKLNKLLSTNDPTMAIRRALLNLRILILFIMLEYSWFRSGILLINAVITLEGGGAVPIPAITFAIAAEETNKNPVV